MTRMSRSAVILRNIASNWLGFVVNAAVTLVLTPYVLRELGVARYGILILTSSVIGYYGFLDLGFRTGVTQYLTRYLALGDYEKANETLSSAVIALSLLGTLMVVLSFCTAILVPRFFTIPAGMEKEAFWCVLVVGISSAIQCFFSAYSSIFTAVQRYDLANLIGLITRFLTAAGTVVALKTGTGLIGVSIAFCGANAIDYVIRWRVSLNLVPNVRVSFKNSSRARLREVASFGGWNFLASVNGYIFHFVPNMLIGAYMPIAALGHYTLATGLFRQVSAMLGPVAQVMYPAAAEMDVKQDQGGLEKLYHRGSRLMMLVMIPTVLGAMYWADDFYRLWIGESYLTGSKFTSVALLFKILLVGIVTSYATSVAQQILIGAGKIRQVSLALIIGSAINLVLSVILIRIEGLAGMAVATVIASVIIDLIAMPILLRRILGFKIGTFFWSSCMRPLIAGLFQALFMHAIRLLGPAEDYFQLALQGMLAVTASLAVLVCVGLTAEERKRFLVTPMRRLQKKEYFFTPGCQQERVRPVVPESTFSLKSGNGRKENNIN